MSSDSANIDPVLQASRRRARRTAVLLALVALAVYALFLWSSLPGR
jgi:HAMP domain-containing protein